MDANQHLYLAGNKEEAVAAVPDELVDEISLVGDEQRIREQDHAYGNGLVQASNAIDYLNVHGCTGN